MPLTDAQKRHIAQQNEQRRHLPRIPTLIITEETHALLLKMAEIYGSKTAALTAGLKALAEKDHHKIPAKIVAPKTAELTQVDNKDIRVKGTVTHESPAYYTITLETGEVQKYSKETGMRVGKDKLNGPSYKIAKVK